MDNNERQLAFLLKHVTDLAHTAGTHTYMTHSDFLSLYEQEYILGHLPALPNVELQREGGYENAERRIIAFIPSELGVGVYCPAPICALHIAPVALKFAQPLTHRDFLGALIGLGIERSMLGDILIEQEHSAYVFCMEHIAGFIKNQLHEVKHTTVAVSEPMDISQLDFQPNFKMVTGTIASERLDSVLSLAYRLSRGTAADLIKSERVYVNGRVIVSPAFTVKAGNIISVRGFGKFIYDGVLGMSRKERLCVSIRIYI